jgi:hypothetical protein
MWVTKIENSCFQIIVFFIVSISQREINVCSTAFSYQLPNLAYFILPASLRVEQQKSKVELETKAFGTISLIDESFSSLVSCNTLTNKAYF